MRDTILCLCDLTGVMARPWVEHGYHAVLVDPQHGVTSEDGAYLKLACTIVEAFDQISGLVRSGRLAFVAGFPPCTDMAVSGAQWFPRKYEADKEHDGKALDPNPVPRNATPEMLARWQEREIALAERQMGGGR